MPSDLAALALYFEGISQMFNPTPIRLVWPTEYGTITQHFGRNPLYYGRFGLPGHEGIDFRAPHGSKIFACADGEVYLVESSGKGNYGNQVRIKHRDGYATVYAHLLKPMVCTGDIVVAGQVIGLADNTGNSSGDHLHLTLKLEGASRPQGGQNGHWTELGKIGESPQASGRRASSRQRASRRPVCSCGCGYPRGHTGVVLVSCLRGGQWTRGREHTEATP